MANEILTVETTINAPVQKVWEYWTLSDHVTKWNSPSDEWFTPRAENDLRPGGKFTFRMEARDGSAGFDFGGEYSEVKQHEIIRYVLDDGRKVDVTFEDLGGSTKVKEDFEPENTNPVEMQQAGWQAIMDNFKKYFEASGNNP